MRPHPLLVLTPSETANWAKLGNPCGPLSVESSKGTWSVIPKNFEHENGICRQVTSGYTSSSAAGMGPWGDRNCVKETEMPASVVGKGVALAVTRGVGLKPLTKIVINCPGATSSGIGLA